MPAAPPRTFASQVIPPRETASLSPGHPAFGRLSSEELRRIVAERIG